MKTGHLKRTWVGIAIVAMLGVSTAAFAGWGMGYGQQGMGYGHHNMGQGYGYGPGGGMHGGGYKMGGYPGALSEDEAKKLDEERRAFFEDTRALRQGIYQKGLVLRSELAKANPDTKTAYDLQKEISGLTAQMDHKRADHHIRVQKISPDVFQGQGFGKGPMGGGFGSRGGGGCSW
ncbi:MAG: periplasmic heavy metal sensor [Deltaproteobacteria bacterium]|nr:periplasmic heavy metal sensor [Deltaproteobacteria bacterium]